MSERTLRIIYWIVTGLLCLGLGFAAFGHITLPNEMRQQLESKAGFFPIRLMPFLGVLKLLGIAVLLWGRRSDLTVGAYAGFFFYGLGALATHLTYGDPLQEGLGAVVIIIFVLASYFLWRRTRGARFDALRVQGAADAPRPGSL